MNDITLHFLACFFITVIVFCIFFWYETRQKNYMKIKRMLAPYKTEKMIYIDILIDSIVCGMIVGICAGVTKEMWDIFYSDPQLHDLVADIGGAIYAGVIIWLMGMKWVQWRFK